MCKPDTVRPPAEPVRLLLSLKSFETRHGGAPGYASVALTGAFVVAILIAIEQAFRQLFLMLADYHPLLEDETNRNILARHIGIDAFCCAVVAILGWQCKSICQGVLQAAFQRKNAMPPAACDARMFTYHPAGFRITMLFFFYQVKNLYDTIAWGDGPEYIFHHCFSLLTSWGGMYPGCGYFYSVFFFGISEISTSVLCLLANFDDEHGVPGLGDAFPLVKVGLGGCFVVLFIICRCTLWPIFSYYFVRDSFAVLKGNDPRTEIRRHWLKFFLVSLSGLSILQVAWLGQIFVIAGEELTKMGFI